MSDKYKKEADSFVKRLKNYRMPFAWAARSVFLRNLDLDEKAVFSELFRHESDKIGADDWFKQLGEYHRAKTSGSKAKGLQTIPGRFVATVSQLSPGVPLVTHGLFPVRDGADSVTGSGNGFVGIENQGYVNLTGGDAGESTDVDADIPRREILEFPPPTATVLPSFVEYANYLYVYPGSVNLTAKKASANCKARNIVCKVALVECVGPLSGPPEPFLDNGQPCIFGKSSSAKFTTVAQTAVLYHNKQPSFNEEVKIKLPFRITKDHHLFFTFSHISVDDITGKKGKQMETAVG